MRQGSEEHQVLEEIVQSIPARGQVVSDSGPQQEAFEISEEESEFRKATRQRLEAILDEVSEELLDNIELLITQILQPALERAAYGGPDEEI